MSRDNTWYDQRSHLLLTSLEGVYLNLKVKQHKPSSLHWRHMGINASPNHRLLDCLFHSMYRLTKNNLRSFSLLAALCESPLIGPVMEKSFPCSCSIIRLYLLPLFNEHIWITKYAISQSLWFMQYKIIMINYMSLLTITFVEPIWISIHTQSCNMTITTVHATWNQHILSVWTRYKRTRCMAFYQSILKSHCCGPYSLCR